MSGFDNLNTDFYQTSYSIDDQSQQSYDYGGSGGPYNKQYAGYDYSQQGRYVPPEMIQPQQPYTGQIFQPTQTFTPTTPQPFYGNSFEDEPPLLEELGINFDHIWQKTLTVLHPLKVADGSIMNETDLAGPMVFCLAFGATLLLLLLPSLIAELCLQRCKLFMCKAEAHVAKEPLKASSPVIVERSATSTRTLDGAHHKRRKEYRKYVKMEEGMKQSLIRKWKIQPIGETEGLLECIEYLMEVQYDLTWK
ncbi:Protein YIPF5 [Myotis brandtii]|uniref:Protein YIPF5 n=1 Tax=Myotis brandtii TaxID=109478 RepID=S7QFM3_MYOBR|nr:Protein YIPF5 [Myotis brandtii]